MPLIVRWLILALAVWVSSELIPGIEYDNPGSILVASLVLGILNAMVKPLLTLLALPFIIVTFGLFLLAINAGVFMLTAWLVPGFHVAGFWHALAGSLIISLISFLMGRPRMQVMDIEVHSDHHRASRIPGEGPIIDVEGEYKERSADE